MPRQLVQRLGRICALVGGLAGSGPRAGLAMLFTCQYAQSWPRMLDWRQRASTEIHEPPCPIYSQKASLKHMQRRLFGFLFLLTKGLLIHAVVACVYAFT